MNNQTAQTPPTKRKKQLGTILKTLVGLALLCLLFYTLFFLYSKDQEKEVIFDTSQAEVSDIFKKTVATGAINPREEIDVKPRVSGVIREIYVEAGDKVKKGDRIARIQIVPNVVQLNQAENRVKTAQINLENRKLQLERNQFLFEQKTIAKSDIEQIKLGYELAEEELSAAKNNLELVKEGALKGSSQSNNIVKATVSGMILDVPVKEGASVIESNNFNEGTSIVTIANMADMIFEGNVDESEVGKLKEGMNLSIQIGAVEDQRLQGMLEYISPKGVVDQGTIQFEIKASVNLVEDVFIRAGYSANAEIILEQRMQVLAVDEGLLSYEDGKFYAEVETSDQVFERREVVTGLSDGIKVEVLSGLKSDDHIKIIEAYGKKYR